MGVAIIVTGYPGSGKSSVAEALKNLLGESANLVEVDTLAKQRGLFSMYDAKRGSHVYDEEYISRTLSELVESKADIFYIFSIFPCILPREKVSIVFVLRAEKDVLKKRMLERKWELEKVEENLEALELGEIEEEAIECFGATKIEVIDTTEKDPREIAELILQRSSLLFSSGSKV
ncbi:MAG: AAA family ATPase [Desulfurococcales archaeon]|nr:AAA family ATPase [Desulfurococcales archaeon]